MFLQVQNYHIDGDIHILSRRKIFSKWLERLDVKRTSLIWDIFYLNIGALIYVKTYGCRLELKSNVDGEPNKFEFSVGRWKFWGISNDNKEIMEVMQFQVGLLHSAQLHRVQGQRPIQFALFWENRLI